jgi:L-asparaginase / beta-aspartyl-peptidase
MIETFSRELAGGHFALIVHGGAGEVPDQRIPRHVEGCRNAAQIGAAVLAAGGSALDAVQRAVEALEDDPVFNAGTGACLTSDAMIELDASIMDGAGLRAGGVCALGPFEHPIAIARTVLEDGQHALYAAAGADAFARAHGFSPVEMGTLVTEAAKKKLESVLAAGKPASWAGGTVGAVALDAQGRVAAATSTGGTSGKHPGRVGDSPIPGAGNYADERAGAASATGNGEGILRIGLTFQVIHALRAGRAPAAAACAAIETMADRTGMTGGVIVVDRYGRLGLARSTRTMTWAAVWDGGGEAGA